MRGVWRRRTNKELKGLYNKPTISQTIRSQRLKWFRQVAKMEEELRAKQVLIKEATGQGQVLHGSG